MSGCLVRAGGGPPRATTVGTAAMHVSRLSSTGPHNRPAGVPHLPGGGWARGSRPECGPAAGAGGSSQASTGRGGPPGWASLSLPGLCIPVSAPWSISKSGLAAPSPRAAPRPWPWLASCSAPAPHPVQPSPSVAPALPGDPERPRGPGFPPGRLERASRRWSLSSQGRRWVGHLCWWGVPCRRHAAHHR